MDFDRKAERASAVTAPAGGSRCWCGEAELEPLRRDYGSCASCGTVVFTEPYDAKDYASSDPASFYGDGYWRRHVPEHLGLPGLEERARSDLSERAVFHLARVLERLAPGARVLELGCGAGSLTYLLGVAGFEASGVELGPAAIELARRHFRIEVHRGPLADVDAGAPFDAIVAVDLLEHLTDPAATMALCARRLSASGLLFLQTPRYRDDGPDWEMLLPREHLFLFTADSVERLLHGAGFAAVEVRGSLFPYDMWVAATLAPRLPRRGDPLAGVAPAAVALIDAREAAERTAGERDAIDADRRLQAAARGRLVRELEAVRDDQRQKEELLRHQDENLRQVRRDQGQKAALIDRLDAELGSVRRDQSAKSDLIERLSRELEAVHRDQTAKGELIERLSSELQEVRGDQAAKEELIERLSSELQEVRGDQAAKEELIERLSSELQEVRGDQAAMEELIERLSSQLQEVRGDQAAMEELISRLDGEREAAGVHLASLESELRQARAALEQIRGDRLYAWLQALRRRLGGGHR